MYTWFLATLVCYYVIGLLTRRIHPGWIALASVVAWAALPLLGTAHGMVGPRPDKFVFYAVFFFAGAALRPVLTRRPVPWAVRVSALAVAAAWALHAARTDAEPQVPVLTQVVVLLAVVGAAGWFQRPPACARCAPWNGWAATRSCPSSRTCRRSSCSAGTATCPPGRGRSRCTTR